MAKSAGMTPEEAAKQIARERMPDIDGKVGDLIKEAEEWKQKHAAARRYVEAAACEVRLAALRHCLAIVEREKAGEKL